MAFQGLAKKVKIFQGMSPSQVRKIASYLKEEAFSRGKWVVEENTPAKGMYLIGRGTVQVWKSVNSKKGKVCLGELAEGDCFGEMALIDCQNRSASVIASGNLKAYYLPAEAMFAIYEEDPSLYGLLLLNISREISRRLRKTDRTYVEFALPPES